MNVEYLNYLCIYTLYTCMTTSVGNSLLVIL